MTAASGGIDPSLVALVVPVSGMIGVLGTLGVQLIKDKWAARNAREEITVTEKQVKVSETEAQTHQMQAIFEGFTLSLAAVSQRATNAEASAAAAHERATSAENRADEQDARIDQMQRDNQRERSILVDHILALEKMVPNPPGPPTRPLPLD